MCCDGGIASPAKTWVVLEGGGSATVGTEAIAVAPGGTVSIPKGVPHALHATTAMTVVEVRHLL